MALILDLLLQAIQMMLVVAIAPAVLGVTRKVKARLLRRIGPPVLQPYRDLWKLLHKEAVLAAQCLMGLSGRALPDLRGDLGRGGAGAVLCDRPAVLVVGRPHRHRRPDRHRALRAGARRHGCRHRVRRHRLVARDDDRVACRACHAADRVHGRARRRHDPALRRSPACLRRARSGCGYRSGLGLFAFMFVAIAENAPIPIDNPATHLELTMVHEAMVLEYSGRHLAMIEAAAALKLVLYFSLIACLFLPFGIAGPGAAAPALAIGLGSPISPRFSCSRRCCRSARRASPRCGCSATRSSSAARSRRRRSPCSSCSCRKASDALARRSTSPICSPAACWS